MRRLAWGLVAVALVAVVGLAGIEAAGAPPATAAVRTDPAPLTRVSLYGDSLAFQARSTFVAALDRDVPGDQIVSTRPGAALCDDRDNILADLLWRRPQVLVLEYSGNSYTGCMRRKDGELLRIGSPAWRNRYLDDLRTVVKVARATKTSVVWATAPPVHHAPDPVNYPRRLTAAVRKIASSHHDLRIADTGTALTTDHRSFSRTLPCRSDERAFCVDRRIPSRAADGLHFDCHGTVNAMGECEGYSAGGRRFGEALAAAALADAPRVSSSPRSHP